MVETHTTKPNGYKRKGNESRRMRRIILIGLFVIAIGLGIWALLPSDDDSELFEDTMGDLQEEVQATNDTIAIPGYEGLTLQANSKKQELSLNNPEANNCYFLITLYLEDGTELWRSELIKAGDISEPIKLNQELSVGTYPAKLKYECFRMDKDKTPLNGAELRLTLRVK